MALTPHSTERLQRLLNKRRRLTKTCVVSGLNFFFSVCNKLALFDTQLSLKTGYIWLEVVAVNVNGLPH